MSAETPPSARQSPPALLAFDGTWETYEKKLHAIFSRELAGGGFGFRGLPISCRRYPEVDGRWRGYWHLIQEGEVEEDRIPDLRRCERLGWIRWVVDNADSHPSIEVWENTREKEQNCLFWFEESYLVVITKRSGYWLLKSAYCTTQSGRIRQLAKERDAFLKAQKS